MANLIAFIEILRDALNEPWIVVIAVLACFLILNAAIRHTQKDVEQIKKSLNNHITETNGKIDTQTARIDKLSERIDRLYGCF